MKRIAGLSLILVLGIIISGCATTPPLEVAKISSVSMPSGTVGADIYATRRSKGEKVPNFAGDQVLDVRSYIAKEGAFGNEAAGKEFAGAHCHVKARYFSANIVTPAKIRVPIYRQYSSPISVSCKKSGYKSRLIEVAAFNKTKSDRHASIPHGAGLVGAVVGTIAVAAINAASDENTHTFMYPMARVIMHPVKPLKPKGKQKTALLRGQ